MIDGLLYHSNLLKILIFAVKHINQIQLHKTHRRPVHCAQPNNFAHLSPSPTVTNRVSTFVSVSAIVDSQLVLRCETASQRVCDFRITK